MSTFSPRITKIEHNICFVDFKGFIIQLTDIAYTLKLAALIWNINNVLMIADVYFVLFCLIYAFKKKKKIKKITKHFQPLLGFAYYQSYRSDAVIQ